MNSVTLTWSGLQELRVALQQLPDDLTEEARGIVMSHGDRAAATIVSNYPEHKGWLKKGVSVRVLSGTGRFYAGVEVRNTAFDAGLYEVGTAGDVRTTTKTKANRGVMPPAPPARAFRPVIIRERAAMWIDFRGLLQRAGLIAVGGD